VLKRVRAVPVPTPRAWVWTILKSTSSESDLPPEVAEQAIHSYLDDHHRRAAKLDIWATPWRGIRPSVGVVNCVDDVDHFRSMQEAMHIALALPSAPMQVILSVRYGLYQMENAALLLHHIRDKQPPANVHYGITVSAASQNVSVTGCRFSHTRHAVTTGGSSGALQNGVQRNIIISNCTSMAADTAHFGTHDPAENVS
jgi:hypothetical protein